MKSRRPFYFVSLLLLPALILWHRDDILYSPPLHTDPWFYLGYFRTLVDFKRDLFPNFHAGDRLSWILPGYAVHALFGPVAANAILHLAVHSIAVLSLFSILRTISGLRAAFLTAVVFSFHPWLWATTGWDYVDGAGIAYCLLTLALLTQAAVLPSQWKLLLAGATLAAMVDTNLWWIALAPLLPLCYFALTWAHRPLTSASILRDSSLLLAGLSIFCAILAGANYLLSGTIWFLAPTFAQARAYATSWRWQAGIWKNGHLAPWLWFSALATCSVMFLLPFRLKTGTIRKSASALALSIQLLLALAIMAYLNRGYSVLGFYFYASHLVPFAFLAIGSSFWQAAEALSQRAYLTACITTCLLLAAIWFQPENWAQPFVAAGGAILLAAALILRDRKFAVPLTLAGFVLFTGAVTSQAVDLHGSRAQYQRVMSAREKIEALRDGNPVWFWFDQNDPDSADYFALNSTYLAEFSRLGLSLPADACNPKLDAGALVVASSSRAEPAGEIAAGHLANCWRPFGMKPVVEETDRYEPARLPAYNVAMVRAVADPSLRHPLRPIFDSSGRGTLQLVTDSDAAPAFPPERWVAVSKPADHGSVRMTDRGIEVRTPRSAFGVVLTYAPLAAPVTGRYRFAIEFSHRSGQFSFGARPLDESRYLAEDVAGHRNGAVREMSFWVDLAQGDTILLRIANNNNSGDGAASFLMGNLTAIEVDRSSGN